MVSIGVCSDRPQRRVKPGSRLPPAAYAGLPDALRVRPAACPSVAAAAFVSICLDVGPRTIWDSSCIAGLPDLPLRLHPQDSGHSVGAESVLQRDLTDCQSSPIRPIFFVGGRVLAKPRLASNIPCHVDGAASTAAFRICP